MSTKTDRLPELTADFIAALEAGENGETWTAPWTKLGLHAPRNIVSRKRYSGMNHLRLAIAAMAAGQAPLFASFKQWQAKHLQVRKGETGNLVVRWIEVGERGPDGKPKVNPKTGKPATFMVSKVYSVFGVWQVDDMEGHEGAKVRQLARFGFDAEGHALHQRSEVEAHAAADACFAALGADVRHGGDEAAYSPAGDFIAMPKRHQFRDAVGYYSTLAHEHGHWTGHASRLGRDGIVKFDSFGSAQYAFEELVAELCAAFMGNLLGYAVEARADHARYLGHWVAMLKADPKVLLRAASAAEKAATWMLDRANVDLGDDIASEGDETDDATMALAA